MRNWIETSPPWLSVEGVEEEGKSLQGKSLQSLDPGEREAIVLAKEEAGILLIDEQAGRQVARNFGLEVNT